jgi:HSP20 family protein
MIPIGQASARSRRSARICSIEHRKGSMIMSLLPSTRDFISLRDAVDRLLEESLITPRRFFPRTLFDGMEEAFPVDLSETADAYVLKASLPGVKPEDVQISATADTVTIKGEYGTEKEVKEATYLRRERRAGSFERSFSFTLPIEPDKVVATQAEGILTLTLPKSEKEKPKRVQVKVGAQGGS